MNSWIATAKTRSPPSSWAGYSRRIHRQVGHGSGAPSRSWGGGGAGVDVGRGDAGRALPVRAAGTVRGGAPAADDDHVLSGGCHRAGSRSFAGRAGTVIRGSGLLLAGDHAVGGDQVLHREVD